MTNDPNFSSEFIAAGAPVPDVAESYHIESNVTEQLLLHLFRYVQYCTRQPELTNVETILFENARDVFLQLSKACEVNTAVGKRSFGPSDLTMELEPLPSDFLDQDLVEWEENKEPESTSKRKTKRSKKATSTKAPEKKSKKRKSTRKKSNSR